MQTNSPIEALPIRHDLFGWPVDRFDKGGLLSFVTSRIDDGPKTVVANLNLHALHCLGVSPEMDALFSAPETYVHIDGMPIVWLSKMKGETVTRDNRLTYLDWAVDLLAMAEESGWRVAYLGSDETINAAGVAYFRERFPTLDLRGWHGFFSIEEADADPVLASTLEEIDAFAPDLLIVGMGMPRQEAFLHRFSDRIGYKVAVCAGAFLEYFVGVQSLPPRWTGRMGLEGVWRLASNPRRYGHRYLVEPLSLSVALGARMIRRRRLL